MLPVPAGFRGADPPTAEQAASEGSAPSSQGAPRTQPRPWLVKQLHPLHSRGHRGPRAWLYRPGVPARPPHRFQGNPGPASGAPARRPGLTKATGKSLSLLRPATPTPPERAPPPRPSSAATPTCRRLILENVRASPESRFHQDLRPPEPEEARLLRVSSPCRHRCQGSPTCLSPEHAGGPERCRVPGSRARGAAGRRPLALVLPDRAQPPGPSARTQGKPQGNWGFVWRGRRKQKETRI